MEDEEEEDEVVELPMAARLEEEAFDWKEDCWAVEEDACETPPGEAAVFRPPSLLDSADSDEVDGWPEEGQDGGRAERSSIEVEYIDPAEL